VRIVGACCVAGREAAVPMRARIAQGGKILELDVIDVVKVDEQGRIERLRAFFDLSGARPAS
jgi:ketosteroid isomerase-like protein